MNRSSENRGAASARGKSERGADLDQMASKAPQALLIEQFALARDIASDLEALGQLIQDDPSATEAAESCRQWASKVLDMILASHDAETGAGTLQVAVIGGFSAGKSMLINSLIGKDICPVDQCPTTSSISRFLYGTTLRVEERGKGEISIDDYQRRVQHGLKSKVDADALLDFEVYYPYPALRDITIIDTPGFGNPKNAMDAVVTRKVAEAADVVLFVIDINAGSIGADILGVVRDIKSKQRAGVQWKLVINQADTKPPAARAQVAERLKTEHHQLFDEAWLYSARWAKMTDAAAQDSWLHRIERAVLEWSKSENGASGPRIDAIRDERGEFFVTIQGDRVLVRPRGSAGVLDADAMRENLRGIARLKDGEVKRQVHEKDVALRAGSHALLKQLDALHKRASAHSKQVESHLETYAARMVEELEQVTETVFSNSGSDVWRCVRAALQARELSKAEMEYTFSPYATVELDLGTSRDELSASGRWNDLSIALEEHEFGEFDLSDEERAQICEEVCRRVQLYLRKFLDKVHDDLEGAEAMVAELRTPNEEDKEHAHALLLDCVRDMLLRKAHVSLNYDTGAANGVVSQRDLRLDDLKTKTDRLRRLAEQRERAR